MRRTLLFATLLLVCAAAAPACLLDSGALEAGGTAGSTTTGTSGAAGVSGAAGAAGSLTTGGSAGDSGSAGTAGSGGSAAVCGNGLVEMGEQCDDGDAMSDDGCTNCKIDIGFACTNEAGMPSHCEMTCGDGKLDKGEECDDDNKDDKDGCSPICQVEPGWMCTQPGKDPNKPSQCATVCGDGILTPMTETCDDGNTMGGDGCSDACSAVEPGWTCMGQGPGSCTTTCGDGIGVGMEECDDGNVTPGDGCDTACKAEHKCGNGIVDPTEQCDPDAGMDGCNPDCTLDPMAKNVCSEAPVIAPEPADAVTGVITTDYNGDSSGSMLTAADLAPETCDSSINNPVLHRYTTGKQGSIVTIESMSTQTDAMMSGTFGNTVLWVYRDCLSKSDIEGCNDEGVGIGHRSRFTTGYLPARSTIFIVISGEGGGGGGDKGKYRLHITEQPVRLFYYNGFPNQAGPGLSDQMGDLSIMDVGGDGSKWQNCMPGLGSNCDPVMGSHSGGAYAFATDKNDMSATNILLLSDDIPTPGVVTQTFFQIDGRGKDTGGANEFFKVESSPDGVMWSELANYVNGGWKMDGRIVLSPSKSDKIRFKLTYGDGGADVLPVSVDDIYVYGY